MEQPLLRTWQCGQIFLTLYGIRRFTVASQKPPVPILSQINLMLIFQSDSRKIHFNIILLSTPSSLTRSSPFRLLIFVRYLSNIWWRSQIIALSFLTCIILWWGIVNPRATTKLEKHPFSAVHDYLFSMLAVALHICPQPEDAPCRGDGTRSTWPVDRCANTWDVRFSRRSGLRCWSLGCDAM
jgi:hypothetical protein